MAEDIVSSNLDRIEIWYGRTKKEWIDKKKVGIEIKQNEIVEVKLTESMFNLLPKLELKLMDANKWFNTYIFQPGVYITIKITPKHGSEEDTVEPYVFAEYVIEGVNYHIDQSEKTFIYDISCIYSAEKYITAYPIYPTENLAGKAIGAAASAIGVSNDGMNQYKKTSCEVIEEILEETGLGFNNMLGDEAPKDKMLWVNAGQTYAVFVNKIVSHMWLGLDDVPISYVDKNGNFTLYSLNNLCKKQSTTNFMYDQRYNNLQDKAKNEHKAPPQYLTYSNIGVYNVAYNQLKSGYVVKASIYNPYSREEINAENQKIQTQDDEEHPHHRTITLKNEKLRLGMVGNASLSARANVIANKWCGIHFKETHEYYDVAPVHNKNVTNQFFTKFAMMTVDTNLQSAATSAGAGFYPSLGDKVYIDMADMEQGNMIQSGNFIICGLTHKWVPGKSYTIISQCVNDGFNSEGPLSQSDKDKLNGKKG